MGKKAELIISIVLMSFVSLIHPHLFTYSLIISPYFVTKYFE